MAHITNPRKVFNFTIQIAPYVLDPWLCQRVTIPDLDVEPVEHGDANYDVKTAGRKKVGSLTIEKLMVSDNADNYMYNWQETCQSQLLGGGSPPDIYKRPIIITELAEDGATPLNSWTAFGCWPSKISGQKFDRQASENVIENIEIQVDELYRV